MNIKKVLQEKKIDIALFCTFDSDYYDKNQYYLSGYRGMGCLVVPRNKPSFLLVPEMEYERAKQDSKVRVMKWKKGKRLFDFLKEVLRKRRIRVKTLGISRVDMNLAVYRSLKKYIKGRVKDIALDCVRIRRIKSKEEIKILGKACSLTDKILQKCISRIRTFKTEKEVEQFLHVETIKQGCELAFKPIVASGKGASMPHYEAKNISLRKGFLVIDFGIKYKGYHADMTRTIYLGKPSQQEKKVYSLLLETQKKVIMDIKLGKRCTKSFEETVSLLGTYGKYFTHGLGHGIGLQIHEWPNLLPASKDSFENNMVFTVEPGIYVPGKFGMRIEDSIVMEKGRLRILTKTPKKLIVK
ncbi:aminopeptidase P family protein [Candidatus Woesearchaeota archaeon]|nr:aminopeptidase P family protein [Candidatus Woesearchaeota archaeon]